MRTSLMIVAVAAACATPVLAQSPIETALARLRAQQIELIEAMIEKSTAKTTNVIFAKRYGPLGPETTYCGEALLGSRRAKYIVQLSVGLTVPASEEDWEAHGCNGTPTATLIDLR